VSVAPRIMSPDSHNFRKAIIIFRSVPSCIGGCRGSAKPSSRTDGGNPPLVHRYFDAAQLTLRGSNFGRLSSGLGGQYRRPNDSRKRASDLFIAFEEGVHRVFLIKTPPVTEVSDGAFETIFPVDFSLVVSLKQTTLCRLSRSYSSPAFSFILSMSSDASFVCLGQS
jgi:hypothetical protein